ncbi:long-chain fatty acid--CoA ligase [Nocardia sp. NEAU-G5]|uniref:Long-chain fatty acid--CoA ligase n=1 Tax=Nocardia albiluteola TaxID=2842303 RepID=A0ABS6B6G7_9NOCA|nr:long-chain fatty acid--CoA ligase [Nocardia albiluteola]MBU3065326.1 long-chain fatty acid--CoA ligase [Nocardia albiluteola]
MRSTMQPVQLQIGRLLKYATTFHGDRLLLTATPEGARTGTYHEIGTNAARLAWALRDLGIGRGDRVATFMWNNQEHTEAYFAIPSMGAVLHPLNIRLSEEQIVFTANHAQDRVALVDGSLLARFAELAPRMLHLECVIVNGPADATVLSGSGLLVYDYANLLAAQPDQFPWPDLNESTAAALCYTSGTTGDPKGVVYSHRSIYLHAMAVALPNALGLGQGDRILAVVPQFHVLAWGLPYAAFLTGASLAMPDRFLAAAPLAAFIDTALPTKGAGVPTIWQSLLDHLDEHPGIDISTMREALVGGSACPPSLIAAYRKRHNIALIHAWGMTETSPLGAVARVTDATDPDRLSQGRFPAQVEARLVGADGTVLPHNGISEGELQVRGPWVTGEYHGEVGADAFQDGWLRTADIGVITPRGYLTITDRAKDVIKSGGEWISSVGLENELMAHPAVPEAAVIGVPDHRWGERPMACVVVRGDGRHSLADIAAFLATRVPKWKLPERWSLLAEIPKTSVGKYDKASLRQWYAAGTLHVEYLASPDSSAVAARNGAPGGTREHS